MWFIKSFIVLIGLGLIYMIFTQVTIPMGSPGHYRTWSLWDHPVRFIVSITVIIIIEWFLIQVYSKAKEEENTKKKKRKRKRRA